MDMPEAAPGGGAPAPGPARPAFGELMPHFVAASDHNPRFQTKSLGGQWMVLAFFGSLSRPDAAAAHQRVQARRQVFDDRRAMYFGVSIDPVDRERGVRNSLPGVRYFWDFDQLVSRRYGAITADGYQPLAFLIDPGLRVVAVEPLQRFDQLIDRLETHLEAEAGRPETLGAPVLTIPRVLEPDFCRALIAYYDRSGGRESGFMREDDGVTYAMLDDGTKKRRDVIIEDEPLRDGLNMRLGARLCPQILQAFWWRPTRIERYIVACYSAEERGFFKTHRDNTTSGTAHRRFAVSINLNDDFDGGDLRFPEFGSQTYRPPLGGATVFSCALLHEATPVTRGLRYATLPFLYDEEGARIREANKDRLSTAPATRRA